MPGLVFVMLTTQLQGGIAYYSAPFATDQIADCEHDTPVTTQPVAKTVGHFGACTINGCNVVGDPSRRLGAYLFEVIIVAVAPLVPRRVSFDLGQHLAEDMKAPRRTCGDIVVANHGDCLLTERPKAGVGTVDDAPNELAETPTGIKNFLDVIPLIDFLSFFYKLKSDEFSRVFSRPWRGAYGQRSIAQ